MTDYLVNEPLGFIVDSQREVFYNHKKNSIVVKIGVFGIPYVENIPRESAIEYLRQKEGENFIAKE